MTTTTSEKPEVEQQQQQQQQQQQSANAVDRFVNNVRKKWSDTMAQFPWHVIPATFVPDEINEPTLYCYGCTNNTSDNSAPTFDVDCLKIIALAKFCNVSLRIEPCNEPEMSPNGRLPFLAVPKSEDKEKKQSVSWLPYNDIFSHILSNSTASLQPLPTDASVKSRMVAYLALVDTKLRPAVLYHLWCEPSNRAIIAPLYASTSTNPDEAPSYLHSLIVAPMVVSRHHQEVVEDIASRQPGRLVNKDDLYFGATEAVIALEKLLQDSSTQWFMDSSHPTALDAAVFACIHLILTLPTVSNELKARLLGSAHVTHSDSDTSYRPGLIKHSKNILEAYFN